ncbi:hypothetical protein BKA64DRAFT_639913 [Cadophora sp. MPI-SDFR-AT-0126]|nr:hypothetical protein BKA64DRAFT_639913 [Leotiomycetes sp. MPI-SDFR-AT-0126]
MDSSMASGSGNNGSGNDKNGGNEKKKSQKVLFERAKQIQINRTQGLLFNWSEYQGATPAEQLQMQNATTDLFLPLIATHTLVNPVKTTNHFLHAATPALLRLPTPRVSTRTIVAHTLLLLLPRDITLELELQLDLRLDLVVVVILPAVDSRLLDLSRPSRLLQLLQPIQRPQDDNGGSVAGDRGGPRAGDGTGAVVEHGGVLTRTTSSSLHRSQGFTSGTLSVSASTTPDTLEASKTPPVPQTVPAIANVSTNANTNTNPSTPAPTSLTPSFNDLTHNESVLGPDPHRIIPSGLTSEEISQIDAFCNYCHALRRRP